MKKVILILSIIVLYCQCAFAQTGGVNFQGVARNSSGTVLANQKINLKFSILKTSETGTVEYTETKEVTTNAQGVFSVVVGEVNATSFAAIDWKLSPKFLKVEMDPAGGSSFLVMGTTRLQNVPYAYYANGVNASNIDGTVAIAKGGTGAVDAATARTNLGLVIGTDVQAPLTAGTDYLTPTGNAASASKLVAAKKINGVDFDGSADITIPTTADASTLSGTVAIAKGGTGAVDAATARTNLGLVIGTDVQAPLTAGTDYLTPTGNAASASKLATAKKINGIDFDGSADITIPTTADASTLSGTVSIAKGGTGAADAAAARTNLGLIIGTDVQAPLTAGTDYLTPTGSAASLTNFPTLNQNTTGNAATANIAGNITATSNNSLTSLPNLTSVGTLTSGTISLTTDIKTSGKLAAGDVFYPSAHGTSGQVLTTTGSGTLTWTTNQANANTLSGTVSISNGGTGATTAAAARTNLGLVIGTNVQAPLTAGTDYLTPTGSAASLTNFPILNQNTTGNASTASLAGNVTASTNLTLTTLSNLNSVGTITSGIWSSTAISVSNGGTGTSTLSGIVLGNGTSPLSGIRGGNFGEILHWNGSTWEISGTGKLAIGNNAGATTQGINSVAIGYNAGNNNQADFSVAMGEYAGKINQGNSAVSVGPGSGENNQGYAATALGRNSGAQNQGINSVSIGNNSGKNFQGSRAIAVGLNSAFDSQGQNSVAIGNASGSNLQGENSIALGFEAGNDNQGLSAISIGTTAGSYYQGEKSIAIGESSGTTNQGSYAVAIGVGAAYDTQGVNSVAIGYMAGELNQNTNAIALGKSAAKNNQGASSVALGYEAAIDNQGSFSIAIGQFSGYSNQQQESIAIGNEAGMNDQSGGNIAIGSRSGKTMQGYGAIALGKDAAQTNQGSYSIAIGNSAGFNTQENYSIALGYNAGEEIQREQSIAIGTRAGASYQDTKSIAIGAYAGEIDQGTNAIAIGYYAGNDSQYPNSIILNSTGNPLNTTNQGLFIKPIRNFNDSSPVLTYNQNTGEVYENTSKTFVINHPINPSKYLVHASLEGPEAGVYYRGEAKVVNNKFVKVNLPDYVSAFADNFTIQITKIFEGSKSQNFTYETSRVKDNSFTVYGKNGSFYWTVYAKRNNVEVEPNKSEFELRGDGPYKYLKKNN